MAISGDGQLGMDERAVDDKDLESALERRLQLHDNLAEVRKSFTKAHERAVELLAKHDLEDGEAIRVGRFRVTKSLVEGKDVEYSTNDRSQLRFQLVAQ